MRACPVHDTGRALRTQRNTVMAFDLALTDTTWLLPQKPIAETPVHAPVPSAEPRQDALFRRGEGVALAAGSIAFGVCAGALLFFGMGRLGLALPLAMGLAGYIYAIHLACQSWSDVIAARSPSSIALFGLHVVALAAWPIVALCWPSAAWQAWLGLPMALIALSVFLVIARAPARAMYRTTAHVCLIAAIGAYQELWTAITAST
jgi:hypothetical protein